MSTEQVLALFRRRDELLESLADINSRIVRATLDLGKAARAPAARGGTGKGGRRKWFERGEMLTLTKKLLVKPMAQADLVRALSNAKGYDKSLAAEDRTRFQSACYQAIAAAIEAKRILRDRQGKIALRKSA